MHMHVSAGWPKPVRYWSVVGLRIQYGARTPVRASTVLGTGRSQSRIKPAVPLARACQDELRRTERSIAELRMNCAVRKDVYIYRLASDLATRAALVFDAGVCAA